MEEKLYPLSSFLAFKPCQASTNPAEILPLSTQLSAFSSQPDSVSSRFSYGIRVFPVPQF
jgi:hypothetical protein